MSAGTDNALAFHLHLWLLRVHSFLTGGLLFFASLCTFIWLYIGRPVVCLNKNEIICLHYSGLFKEQKFDSNIAYPGIAQPTTIDVPKAYTSYEWVWFVFLLQAFLFCFPHWLWSCCWQNESGAVAVFPIKTNFRPWPCKTLVTACTFYVCELLCFVNVVSQGALIDQYFNFAFTENGLDVFQFTKTPAKDRNDTFIDSFPRKFSCRFHKFGASGTLQSNNDICFLTMSPFIEKIFMVLWFWFVFLSTITAVVLVYRITIILLYALGLIDVSKDTRTSSKEDCQPISMNEIGNWQNVS